MTPMTAAKNVAAIAYDDFIAMTGYALTEDQLSEIEMYVYQIFNSAIVAHARKPEVTPTPTDR